MPAIGEIYTSEGGQRWQFNGRVWELVGSPGITWDPATQGKIPSMTTWTPQGGPGPLPGGMVGGPFGPVTIPTVGPTGGGGGYPGGGGFPEGGGFPGGGGFAGGGGYPGGWQNQPQYAGGARPAGIGTVPGYGGGLPGAPTGYMGTPGAPVSEWPQGTGQSLAARQAAQWAANQAARERTLAMAGWTPEMQAQLAARMAGWKAGWTPEKQAQWAAGAGTNAWPTTTPTAPGAGLRTYPAGYVPGAPPAPGQPWSVPGQGIATLPPGGGVAYNTTSPPSGYRSGNQGFYLNPWSNQVMFGSRGGRYGPQGQPTAPTAPVAPPAPAPRPVPPPLTGYVANRLLPSQQQGLQGYVESLGIPWGDYMAASQRLAPSWGMPEEAGWAPTRQY